MRFFVTIGFFLLLITGWATPGVAQSASVGISTDSVLVGERFHFTVNVHAKPGQVVLLPSLSQGSLPVGDVEFIRRVSQPGPPASTDSATYEVAVFGIDSALVGGLPIAVIKTDGDTLFFASPTVPVGIRSVVPEDAAGLKDLAPLATFPLTLWPWIVGTVLALALAWFLVGYFRKRGSKKPAALDKIAPRIDPYDEALGRLRSLADVHVDSEEDIQKYHDELSDILRTYIEKTLAVPALERTTGELLGALSQLSQVASDYVSEEVVQRVAETLGISDLVKFAKYSSREVENRRALDLARESIEDIEGGRRRRMAMQEAEAETA
ncbi:MAG: hypothetical protein WBW88_05780 [Rhodothermales bacterium]